MLLGFKTRGGRMAIHRTEFDVDASDEQVWAVLVDFERWGEWNPSVPSISGDVREGSTVSLTLVMPGRPKMNVKAVLQEVTPGRRLTWRGHLAADRIFTGYRELVIEPLAANKVRVTHVEDLQGWIAPVFEKLMGGAVQAHHDAFNEALKRRAESVAGAAPATGS
jgi:hypothetical protein